MKSDKRVVQRFLGRCVRDALIAHASESPPESQNGLASPDEALSTQDGAAAIELHLGAVVLDAIHEFALYHVQSPAELETTTFSFIKDPKLRSRLSETLFGARWLYKLGLVTVAADARRAAHVRAQIIDYASICEGVLVDAVTHGLVRGHFTGKAAGEIGFVGPGSSRGAVQTRVRKRYGSFAWMLKVAREERMVDLPLWERVDWLRDRRNGVHVAEVAATDVRMLIDASRHAYTTMVGTIDQIGAWVTHHP
jgi:hypothetical protein